MTFAIALFVLALDTPQMTPAALWPAVRVSAVALQGQTNPETPGSRPGGPPLPPPPDERDLPAPSLPSPEGEKQPSPPKDLPRPPNGEGETASPQAPPAGVPHVTAQPPCPGGTCPPQVPLGTTCPPSAGLSTFQGPCPTAGCAPACQTYLVERKIMVPTTVMETQTVRVTKYRPEIREQTVTVHRQVPEVREVPQQYTVMVPQQRTRTVTALVPREVVRSVEQPYTVMVPHQERRQGFHTVTRMVAVPETRMVSRMAGRWETRAVGRPYMTAYGGACAPCLPAACTTRVWVPEVIQQPVTVTTMKPIVEQRPYEYSVTVFRPETRSRTIQLRECVTEQVSREETFVVHVPETRVRNVQVTEYRTVPEQQRQQCTVMVPYEEEAQVQVPVCRMVEQTVTTPVQTCSTTAPCGPSCPPAPCPTGACPTPAPALPVPGLGIGPAPGLAPGPWYAGLGRFDLPIFRDLVTGRTYRYPPPEIPRDRLFEIPSRLGYTHLTSYGLW